MNYRDNELSIPWMPPTNEGAISVGNSNVVPFFSTKIGGSQNSSNAFHTPSRRNNTLGEVSTVLSHVEYLNMDGHLVNEHLKTRDMIRLKELSLYQNFVGSVAFEDNSSTPRILDLNYATDLKRLNFGNERYTYLPPLSFTMNPSSTTASVYDALVKYNIHRDLVNEPLGFGGSYTDPVGFLRGDGADGLGVRGPDGYLQGDSGYLHGYHYGGGLSSATGGAVSNWLDKFYGNSVLHGFVDGDANSTGSPIVDYFSNFDNNTINYILNTPGDNLGQKFINLEYLNINNQEYGQVWEQFQFSEQNVNHMVDTDPRTIYKRQVQLNLEHCTDLQELHIQGTAVPSIYVNNGFETGYYPNSYQGLSTDQNETKLLSNDFAYHPNLRVVCAH